MTTWLRTAGRPTSSVRSILSRAKMRLKTLAEKESKELFRILRSSESIEFESSVLSDML